MRRQIKRILTITLALLITVSFSFDSRVLPFSQVEKAYAGGSDEKTLQRVGKETILTNFDLNAQSISTRSVINERSTVFDPNLYAMVFKTGYTSGAAVEQLFLKYVPVQYSHLSDKEKEKHALYRRIDPSFISQSTNYRMDKQYIDELQSQLATCVGLITYYEAMIKQSGPVEAAQYKNMLEPYKELKAFLSGLIESMNQVLEKRSIYENDWEGSYLQIQNTVKTSQDALKSIELGKSIFTRDYKFNPTSDAIKGSLNEFEAQDQKILQYITEYETASASYYDFIAKGETEKQNNNVRQSDYYFVQAREQLEKKQNAVLGIEKRKREIIYEQTGRKTNNISVSKSVKEYGTTDNVFASDNTTTILFNFDFTKFELLDVSILMKEASTGGGRIDNWSLESWDIYKVTNSSRDDLSIEMYSNISDSTFIQFNGVKLYSYVSNLDGLAVSSSSLLQDNDGEDINLIRIPVYGTGSIEASPGSTMIVQDENGEAVEVTTESKPTLVIDNDSLKPVEPDSITEQLYGSNPEVFPRLCKVSDDFFAPNGISEKEVQECYDIINALQDDMEKMERWADLFVEYNIRYVPDELDKLPAEHEDTKVEMQRYFSALKTIDLFLEYREGFIDMPNNISDFVDYNLDKYTFELSLSDNKSGGFEELNKWPLEPKLEFFEYLYADIEYYDGTMLDGYPKLKTLKLPVITNAILKAGSEDGSKNIAEEINNGRVLSFAQQGEKLVFDAVLPSCVNISSIKLSYEASIDNFASDEIDVNAIKVYRDSQIDSISYEYPFLNAKINVKPGQQPLYSYTSGTFNGISIYVDSSETIDLNPSGHADLYPERDIEDLYLVKVQTSSARSAGTDSQVGLSLKYVDTKGNTQYTTEYNLSDSMEDFYGYWIGEVEDSSGGSTQYYRENAAFRIGSRPGGEFCMVIEAQNLSHFTGFRAELLESADDDWQIESMKIIRLTELGDRIAKTVAQSNAEYEGLEDEEFVNSVEDINGISIDRYYTREYDGDVLIGDAPGEPGYQIRVLIQPESVKEYDFVTQEEEEIIEHRDSEEYSEFLDYKTACTDLKFTKNDRKYTVKVSIPENSTQGVRDDGCGSRNLFYFQLIFENGESGYVLANSQMTTDGFIAGTISTFTIYTNSDKGDIVEVNIIPDDLDKESDVLDKLYIEKIEVIRDNPNGIARRFICNDVGWVTRDYHSNDETELKGQVIGRTKQELVCRYAVSERAWVLKYEFAITTGQTINTKYGQYDGPLKADIIYETSNGSVKTEQIDVAAAMYEYNNKSPKKNDDNIVVIDPERMLRPETTDRFFINIPDAVSINTIKFIAEGGKENANWTINNISISLVTSNSTLWINENDEYQMQYEKEGDPQLIVDRITNANLPSLFTIYSDVKNTKKFVFEENHIPEVDEFGQSVSVASRVPQSHNDEFNVFIYLEKDKVTAEGKVNPGAISPKNSSVQIGTTIYYTGQYNDYKVEEKKLQQTEIDGYHVMYALGISAEQFISLQAVGVSTSQASSASVKANVPVAYAILQHIRGDVVCDTYYVKFGGSDPSLLSGKTTTSSIISSLAQEGEYQTVDIAFGNGTKSSEIVPLDEDIAFAIQYESFNIDGKTQKYWSPYVFLSDDTMELGTSTSLSIDAGQNKQIKFNVPYLSNVTALKVVSTGSIKASVDNAVIKQYGFTDEGNIDLLKSYGLIVPVGGNTVKTGGTTYQTDQDAELTPVTFKFTVADPMQNMSVGTTNPVRLRVNYDSYADKKKKSTVPKSIELSNITGSGFEASKTKEVSVLLEDLKEIRNVQLIPDDTLKLSSASYTISGGTQKTVLVANNEYTDENRTITINFADIIVRVNGITYKSDGQSVRSNETTDNGKISLAANPGEKFILAIDVKNQLSDSNNSGYTLKFEKLINGAKSLIESNDSTANSDRILYTVPENNTANTETYLFTVASKESPDLKSTVELMVAPKSNPLPDALKQSKK